MQTTCLSSLEVVVVMAWVAFSVYVVAGDAWVGGFGAREVAYDTVAQTLHKLLILFITGVHLLDLFVATNYVIYNYLFNI